MAERKDYKRSLDDEIDWKIIDQLHAATINFSTTSLELKKLLIVLIGIAVPSLIKLAGDKLDVSLFITIYISTVTFWFLDSFTYYYQEKLREKMNKLFNDIKKRNRENIILSDKQQEEFTLENNRKSRDRIWRSAINPSVRIYVFIIVINTFAFVLYSTELIN